MIGGAETPACADTADRWGALVAVFAGLFHQPTGIIFTRIVSGWVLCPGRHTITRMYPLAEPDLPVRVRTQTGVLAQAGTQTGRHKAHDAYHRFFRAGVWCMNRLWEPLARRLVARFHPRGVIPMTLDDTAFHKSGRKIEGAGWWRLSAVPGTGRRRRTFHGAARGALFRPESGGAVPARRAAVGWRTLEPADQSAPASQG